MVFFALTTSNLLIPFLHFFEGQIDKAKQNAFAINFQSKILKSFNLLFLHVPSCTSQGSRSPRVSKAITIHPHSDTSENFRDSLLIYMLEQIHGTNNKYYTIQYLELSFSTYKYIQLRINSKSCL